MLKSRILVVDDSEINRGILSAMLEEEFSVSEATNGREALDFLERDDMVFRLVLLDIQMPVMNGYEVLDEMRKQGLLNKIPVIIISGDHTEETLSKAYALGAIDFFTKPFNLDIVLHRVHNVIGLYRHEYIDAMTGAYSRNGFVEMAESFLKGHKASDYAMIYMDIKNFKAINVLCGTKGGDIVLQESYKALNQLLDPVLDSRVSSDHFTALVERKNLTLGALAELINQNIMIDKIVNVRSKIGVYEIKDEPHSVVEMMDRAKIAKETITDDYVYPYAFFDASMENNYIDKALVLSDFQRAIINEEYKVYYQPIVDAKTEKLVSAEALVRWIHPERGFVRPDQFVPILENDGYISRLDYYVAEKVNQLVKRRTESNLPMVPVSVNLSWMDFYDDELVNNILNYIKNSELSQGAIRYEITESSFAALKEDRRNVVGKMREEGAWILIDDFGTGYSSLSMLTNYSFDILKIDMSFIRKIENDPIICKMIEMLVNLAHEMKMKTVAEGVETENQLKLLREMGCDYIQGYYFCKPIPEEDFEKYIDRRKTEGMVDEHYFPTI